MRATATPDRETAQTWCAEFNSTDSSVPQVRQQVRKKLGDWLYAQDDIDCALLVVSELATNAVQHGHVPGYGFEVTLTSTSRTCLVEVSDASPRRPEPQTATSEQEYGRGLHLVDVYSTQVGHRKRWPVGKTVWARLVRTQTHNCESPAQQDQPT